MSKAKEKHQCCGQIWISYSHSFCQCSNNGKVEVDGKWYCGIHDPVRVKEADRKRTEKYNADRAASQAKWKHEERQLECTAKMFSMAPKVLRLLEGTEPFKAWGALVREAIECGLITEDSK